MNESLRFVGGVATIAPEALLLRPWYARRPVALPWSNVMFVCPTPALRRRGQTWTTFRGEPLTAEAIRAGLRLHTVHIVLRQRQALWRAFGWTGRLWLLSLGYMPMGLDDSRWHPHEGLIQLDLHRRGLARRLPELLAFLDGLKEVTRFDSIG